MPEEEYEIDNVSPLIAGMIQPLVSERGAAERARAAAYLPRLAGTARGKEIEHKRLWILINWFILEELPAVFEGMADDMSPDLAAVKAQVRALAARCRAFHGFADRPAFDVWWADLTAGDPDDEVDEQTMMFVQAVMPHVKRFMAMMEGRTVVSSTAHIGPSAAAFEAAAAEIGADQIVTQRGVVQLPVDLYLDVVDRMLAVT